MTDINVNWIANFIWGIADDVLRDLYVRGKYRDVILPMTVLRHQAAGQDFYNIPKFTLRNLRSLEKIRADILALEKETEGLLDQIIGKGNVDDSPVRK